jgi:hypothetical protein
VGGGEEVVVFHKETKPVRDIIAVVFLVEVRIEGGDIVVI